MRPVDNFSAPRLAGLSISVGACRRGECVRCRDLSVGDLSALAGNYFECWACVSTSWSSLRVSAEVFLTRRRERSFSGAAEGRESAWSKARRRPWRSTHVSLAVLRGLRPPEEPGAEPFSERVRQLCG